VWRRVTEMKPSRQTTHYKEAGRGQRHRHSNAFEASASSHGWPKDQGLWAVDARRNAETANQQGLALHLSGRTPANCSAVGGSERCGTGRRHRIIGPCHTSRNTLQQPLRRLLHRGAIEFAPAGLLRSGLEGVLALGFVRRTPHLPSGLGWARRLRFYASRASSSLHAVPSPPRALCQSPPCHAIGAGCQVCIEPTMRLHARRPVTRDDAALLYCVAAAALCIAHHNCPVAAPCALLAHVLSAADHRPCHTASAGERFLRIAMEQTPEMVRDAFSNTIRQGVTTRPVLILSTRTRHITGRNLLPGPS
jgi:hypothetical protein